MASLRRVEVTTIATLNTVPIPFALYIFTLTNNTFTPDTDLSKKSLNVRADKNGLMRCSLWANDQGAIETHYKLLEPDGSKYEFVINSATPDQIQLSALKLLGVTPSMPNYATLFDIINGMQLSFPSGGQLGQSLVVKSLNPQVVDWGEPDIEVGNISSNFVNLLV